MPEGISVSTADAYKGIEPSVPSVPLAERLSMPVEMWQYLTLNPGYRGISFHLR